MALVLAGSVTACADPSPEVESPASGVGSASRSGPVYRIVAESGLEGVAESILSDPHATADFPGLGSPGRWIEDPIELIVVRDLDSLRAHGLGPPERWVAGLADPPARRIALRAGTEIQALGFHQRTAKDYFRTLAGKPLTKALDDRDGRFGDYRTARPEDGE